MLILKSLGPTLGKKLVKEQIQIQERLLLTSPSHTSFQIGLGRRQAVEREKSLSLLCRPHLQDKTTDLTVEEPIPNQ